MRQADKTVIRKMIEYCDQIATLTKRFGCSFEAFRDDFAYQYAVGMCIIQIGELVNRLSTDALAETVSIPWRLIRAMRNVYAHDYDRTKPLTVWQTVTEDIPALRGQLSELLLSSDNSESE